MKWLLVPLLVAFVVSAGNGANKPYETGNIVDVQQKVRTRVLYYQVDTPITKDDPYYEVSVQVKDTIYVGEYTPLHAADTLPEEWNIPRAEVRVRLEKHSMFLIRPTGREMQFGIVKHMLAPPKAAADSASPKK